MKTFLLEIITPYGKYYSQEVEFLSLSSSKGILPNHTPLISDVLICEIVIRKDSESDSYSTSGGIINIKKEKVTLLLNSIEHEEEIDIERAKQAKERAEKNLEAAKRDSRIDIARAEAALSRAINRIKVYSK